MLQIIVLLFLVSWGQRAAGLTDFDDDGSCFPQSVSDDVNLTPLVNHYGNGIGCPAFCRALTLISVLSQSIIRQN